MRRKPRHYLAAGPVRLSPFSQTADGVHGCYGARVPPFNEETMSADFDSTLSLFAPTDGTDEPESFQVDGNPLLSQWFTPQWAAEFLVRKYFPGLSSCDLILEPSCGVGSFIQAIPEEVPVIGVEIDPAIAEIARQNTGRQIITGDFTSVKLPEGVTAVIGNPPFDLDTVDRFLARAHRLLPNEAFCSLLLAGYSFQTWGRVIRWNDSWSLDVNLVPRGLFPGIKLPLAWCMFRKDQRRQMVGLALYAECAAVANLTKDAQELLKNGRPHMGVWRALVEETLRKLGGKATLDEIYRTIEPKRPTATAFWREKVRQQLQRYFHHLGPGEWALAQAP